MEEAIETRNAVYNLQWPPNGGRLLVAEYVDPEGISWGPLWWWNCQRLKKDYLT